MIVTGNKASEKKKINKYHDLIAWQEYNCISKMDIASTTA